jgi:hypothetical protein
VKRENTLDLETKGPAPRFGLPSRVHGAANGIGQAFPVHIGPLGLTARHLAERIFQDQFAVGLVRALDR